MVLVNAFTIYSRALKTGVLPEAWTLRFRSTSATLIHHAGPIRPAHPRHRPGASPRPGRARAAARHPDARARRTRPRHAGRDARLSHPARVGDVRAPHA